MFGVHFNPFHCCHSATVFVIIHNAIATIIRFSVSEATPSGTLPSPPTQAHFSSRFSM
ncbi:hypothetical protein GR216_32075 [Rhizobium leguminosarum]|nr:hypothetical protein [Rhizobium ruizarguesonis]NEJ39725.1 hypothetical protein [Rhizobium ruizarguesonis]